ncbi:hypothetical protein [Vibrio furnissii]|uniref:hypothetical protein n=1 Tax=Vibrio furnissii TaxID=29494 RepID=UPI001180E5D0|nr:hypothetical protein [Vibrio furnissii]
MSEFLFVYLIFCGFVVYFSERTLVSYFLLFCSLYSYISLIIFEFGYKVPFELGQGLDRQLIILPIFIISSCAISFSIGQNLTFQRPKFKDPIVSINKPFNLNKFKSNIFIFFPLLTTLLVVLSVGLDNLLFRSSYVVNDANLTFRKFADITVWLAIIATPFIKTRWLMIIVHILLLSAFSGLGSRSAMVVALAYPIFNYFVNNTSKINVLINLIFASILSVAVMGVRFQPHKGIIPVLDDIMNWNINFEMALYLINYLSSYSILLFSEYLYSHILNFKYFFMSISPLPGFMLDTDGIDQWARFRKSIPHSAISQLYGHTGLIITLCVFFVQGFICGSLKNRIVRTFSKTKLIFSSLVIIDLLFLIPIIRGMQYNLRGVARLEYLVLVITVLLMIAFYFIRIRNRNDTLFK